MNRLNQDPFPDAVTELLSDRGMSLRQLAREAKVDPTHLSRVLRGDKPVSSELGARVAEALGVPAEHFAEIRAALVVDRVREDPRLRDRLYRQLAKRR